MRPVAWVYVARGEPGEAEALALLRGLEGMGPAVAFAPPEVPAPAGPERVLRAAELWGGADVAAVLRWFEGTGAEALLWLPGAVPELHPDGLRRLLAAARDTGAGLVYADYVEREARGGTRAHPLVDYQPGSLRDDFDFGPLMLLPRAHLCGLAEALEREAGELRRGGLVDLRLRLSERAPVVHLVEPVCCLEARVERPSGQRIFDYVDPKNRAAQVEMERVATAHLRRIGAWLPPPTGPRAPDGQAFPVEASVVIPVKDRVRTVRDAVQSALSQQAPFAFNVLVVDNRSTDGTSQVLQELGARDPRLVHRIPARRDLGIGGCWNEAVYDPACGRYAVQLDSDDLYAGTDVLARMVAELERSRLAMLVGAYTTVDFQLGPLPPGLVDHAEWSAENGHNNALRVGGLGAPRAFHVPTLRAFGFPNASYAEDYAVGLRMCRSYPLGRIYDSLYWCRRWEGNTDSALDLAAQNRNHLAKDRFRTLELLARQRLARGEVR